MLSEVGPSHRGDSLLRILVADGTPTAMQAERETFGIPSNASLFEAALIAQDALAIGSCGSPSYCLPETEYLARLFRLQGVDQDLGGRS